MGISPLNGQFTRANHKRVYSAEKPNLKTWRSFLCVIQWMVKGNSIWNVVLFSILFISLLYLGWICMECSVQAATKAVAWISQTSPLVLQQILQLVFPYLLPSVFPSLPLPVFPDNLSHLIVTSEQTNDNYLQRQMMLMFCFYFTWILTTKSCDGSYPNIRYLLSCWVFLFSFSM